MEALLDKYADEGIENIEDMKILRVHPLSKFGSPVEIVNLFGGKTAYQQALGILKTALYEGTIDRGQIPLGV